MEEVNLDLVLVVGMCANVAVLLGILGGMAYGYGALNSTVKSLCDDIREIKQDMYTRLNQLEKDVREVMTRCKERGHS